MRLLTCPECGSESLRVLDSRGKGAYRRRMCMEAECGCVFSTTERVISLRVPIHHGKVRGQMVLNLG